MTKWDLMGFYGDLMGSFMGFTGIYPLVLVICYIANWKMAIEIVDLPS